MPGCHPRQVNQNPWGGVWAAVILKSSPVVLMDPEG